MWVCFLLVIATALRVVALGSKSFWLDESASSLLAHADWHTFATALVHRQSNMALYYFLLRGWIHFADTEAWLRFLSVVFGVAAIPVLYLVSEKIGGPRTGRLAALLMSIHVFHIHYSQEARGYSLVMLLSLLSCYFFLGLLTDDSKASLRMYILASILMVYAHVFGGMVLLAQWAFAFLTRFANPRFTNQRKYLATAAAVISIAISPLFFGLLFLSDRSQLSWMGRNSFSGLSEFLFDLTGREGLPLLILFAVLLLTSLRSQMRRRDHSQDEQRAAYLFLWIWLLLPLLIAGAVSLRTPILQSRYMIICLPAFLIVAAHGLASIKSRMIFFSCTTAVALFLLLGANTYYRGRMDPDRSDNWRNATRYLLSRAQPGDALVFPYSAEEIPFLDYAQRMGKDSSSITFIPQQTTLHLLAAPGTWTGAEAASIATLQHRRVWVVSALQPNAHSLAVVSELSAKLKGGPQMNFGFVAIRLFDSQQRPSGTP